ncbi:hypothetical protein NDU88_005990 [Pleurodeles waltl]|uniref:Uncharacterized protein n=1 Tax=Pleurodeles waltl TaxID=8319 RepID=A0AAV7PL56_PLEWA|nr:hypothetical protein NDU88_005990 [Pleurodeles waltl]
MLVRGSKAATAGAGAAARKERARGSGGAGECKTARASTQMAGSPARKFATKASKALQWDYSSASGLGGLCFLGDSLTEAAQISLELIHQSIMEHQEETKAESRKTQLACRKMQGAIPRVAKTCTDFAIHMGEAETRISKLEDDAAQGEISFEKPDRGHSLETGRSREQSKAK